MADKDSTLSAIEVWKDAPGFEGLYLVSNFGRIRSVPQTYTRKEWRHGNQQVVHVGGNLMKGHLRKRDGRPVCVLLSLKDCKGKKHTKRLHRLVLEAFKGPAPDGMQCCHNNGDPTDNRLENLRWDTPKANQADSAKHGTKVKPPVSYGEAHFASKVPDSEIRRIRKMEYRRGLFSKLARKYGVAQITIRRWYYGEARTSASENIK